MKSLAELAAIKEAMKGKVALREGSGDIRVLAVSQQELVRYCRLL